MILSIIQYNCYVDIEIPLKLSDNLTQQVNYQGSLNNNTVLKNKSPTQFSLKLAGRASKTVAQFSNNVRVFFDLKSTSVMMCLCNLVIYRVWRVIVLCCDDILMNSFICAVGFVLGLVQFSKLSHRVSPRI